jgi:uncharacterized protein (DUF302 family)
MKRSVLRMIARTSLFFAVLVIASQTASADDMRTFKKTGLAYEDVKQDLESAIEHKGLKIGAVGDLADMLARTQEAIGGGSVYKSAHYLQFCSAMLGHKLAAADPANIGHCPFLMFVYETNAKPGEIIVGYRSIIRSGSAATRAVLDEAEAMLDSIAREAVN